MPHINFWAVLISAVIYFLLGWAWHSNLLFGKTWIKLMGYDKLSKKEKQAMMAKAKYGFGFAFLTAILTTYCLAYLVITVSNFYHSSGIFSGLQAGFWTWLGFVATTQLSGVLWERKPFKLYAINASYYLVSFLAMGSILALWP